MRLVLNPITGEFDLVTRPGERHRTGVELSGPINGTNTVFTTPDYFMHDASGASIGVYYNGQRLTLGALIDYTLSESGGPGTGYDTVTLNVAPRVGDRITSDYIRM